MLDVSKKMYISKKMEFLYRNQGEQEKSTVLGERAWVSEAWIRGAEGNKKGGSGPLERSQRRSLPAKRLAAQGCKCVSSRRGASRQPVRFLLQTPLERFAPGWRRSSTFQANGASLCTRAKRYVLHVHLRPRGRCLYSSRICHVASLILTSLLACFLSRSRTSRLRLAACRALRR